MSETKIHRIYLRFVGQVQGVGFRWTARSIAQALMLTGWIKNEYDGSVTAEIQGDVSQIGSFFSGMLAAYKHYPIHYVIDEKKEIPPRSDEKKFMVKF